MSIYRSVTQRWESWEVLLKVEILVDALGWESLVLGLVGFHLSNEVDKMFWLLEQLELLSVNKIAKFILNLDDKLNNVKGIETVVAEVTLEGDGSLLGSSKVVLEDREDVLLDLVVALEHEGVILLGLDVLPHGNLIGGLVLGWDEIDGGVEVEVTLEASGLSAYEGSTEVSSVNASAEADVVSWLSDSGHHWCSGSNETSSHDS